MDVTIDGFEQLTKQQMFDMVTKHMLLQREQAVMGGLCVYETKDGKGCAASVFIRPELRSQMFGSWLYLREKRLVPEHYVGFVKELQMVHDVPVVTADGSTIRGGSVYMADVCARLVRLAHAHGLSASSVYA